MFTLNDGRKIAARMILSCGDARARWLERARRTKEAHPEWRDLIAQQVSYARREYRQAMRFLKAL